MNAPAKITADRFATNLARAKAMHETAGNLLAALTRSGGKYSTSALWAEKALCQAACDLWDDGDAMAALENLRSELPEDDGGDFDAGASHPDSGRFI